MFKQSLGVVLAILIAAAAADAIPDVRSELAVHEWGTFTTVAGEDGRAVAWRPLDGPVDLPCFVERADLPPKLSFVTTVRMETPVIYFYAPRPLTVDVTVGFRQGVVTEFFPRPTSIREGRPDLLGRPAMSRLEWNGIQLLPGAAVDFPSDEAPNHYYAARAADATPLQVGTQREGFLFYRGVGGFELPLRATVNPHRAFNITNAGLDPMPALMVFENRAGRIGFRTSTSPGRQVTIPPLTLDSGIASVRAALVGMLVAEGLYLREAEAMVETWSGSWFEEGARVFYVVPRPLVDHTLPLNIQPVPGVVERVFVGRLEVATPQLLDDLREAFAARDHETLAAHGRFLEPFGRRVLDRGLPADERAQILAALAAPMKGPQAYGCAIDP
ncbi:MAG TPA: hypothetical protein VJ813_18750 [Vicinamibacterales bacterium]|nr:hypothetical protein [Vicinamibacterales bacterium]